MNNDSKLSNESLEENLFLAQTAREDFLTYCQLVDSKYQAKWFHEIIARTLERALERTIQKKKTRIILAIPPRHGKTRTAAELFPSWGLGKHPDIQFILSSYGAELAEKTGLKTRDLINSSVYEAIFPNIALRKDVKAKAKWMITDKSKNAVTGSYTAVGIGGAVTGIGADIIIIDDPHKSRKEAESAVERETVWEYYRSTLYSRLEGSGCIILIMQRWHTDDLVGRILEHEEKLKEAGEEHDEWEVINFPAIAEEDELDPDTHALLRKQGEALWPEKFPLAVLDNIKQTQGIYNFVSQYQQDPILQEAQDFKVEYFKPYEPTILKDKYLQYYTFVDPAIGQKKDSDNTVVLTIAKEVDGPNIYRIREDSGHFTPQQTVDLIFKHALEYKGDVWLETVAYQKALKYAVEEEQRKRQMYFVIQEVKSGNKEVRIRGLIPMYQQGVIHHLPSDFQYEKEALQFPRGKHDDRLDCMSFMLQALENTRSSRYVKQFKKKITGYFQNG